MPNQKTSDYSLVSVAQLTSLIDLANSGVDNEAITVADFLTQIGAGNLGSIDLIQSDPNRTFTFSSNEPSNDLRFRNLSLEESLVINAGCDVYNRGRQQDSTTTIYGFDSGRDLVGNRNTLFGDSVLTETLLGSDNTAFGYQAGHFITGGVVDVTEANCLIAIGSNTRPLADSGTNEIIVGCNLTGNGSNTVTIGDANILNNYFNGDMNIAGLAGVGDRNLVVDATGLLKVATTTNNILSFANLGSFPGTGVIDTIYIALNTDLMYIWDTVNLAYVVFSGDTIYSVNGTITDLTRTLLLNTSDSTSTFQIGNSLTNPILTFRGDLEVFIKPLKATAGNTFNVTIDDTGKLSSAVQSLQSIYTGAGVMTQNAFVDGTGSAFDIDFVNIGDFSILTGGPTKDITFGAGGNVVISLNNKIFLRLKKLLLKR